MGWRQFDFECARCSQVHTDLINVLSGGTPPSLCALECDSCDAEVMHIRLVSAPAQYLGERPSSPMVFGGRHDTAGFRHPEMPFPHCHEAQAADGWGEHKREAFEEHFQSKEWGEWRQQDGACKKENAPKGKRREEIKRGENIDVRHHPLPGDPKF